MNRNILIGIGAFIFLLIVILIIVFATRGGQPASGPTLTFPKEPVTLTWWNLFDNEDTVKDILQSYKEQHSNVTINYVQKEFNPYEDDLLNALAAGTGPDIFTLPHDLVPKHLDKLMPVPQGFNLITPQKNEPKKDLPMQFKELFVKSAYDDLVYGDKVYGVPLWMDSLALYYNPEFFGKAQDEQSQIFAQRANATDNEEEKQKIAQEGQRVSKLLSSAPKNWNDFIEAVKFITKKDEKGNIIQSGIALGTSKNIVKATDILSLLMIQNNAQMVTFDKKTATFNLSVKKTDGTMVYPGTSALDFYTSFARPDKETYAWNNSFSDSVSAFGDGKTAMMFNYSYLTPTFKRRFPDLKFEIAPFPQIKGIVERVDYNYFWPQVVSKSTPYPIVAWDFLKFISSKEHSAQYDQATQRPTANLEKAKEVAGEAKTAYLEEFQGSQVFDAQALTATNWYKGGEPQKADEIFRIMIEAVADKGQSLQAAIDSAAASVTNVLGEAEPLIERKKQEP